jgi:hypothetical protein
LRREKTLPEFHVQGSRAPNRRYPLGYQPAQCGLRCTLSFSVASLVWGREKRGEKEKVGRDVYKDAWAWCGNGNMNLKVEWSINKEIFYGKSRSKVDRGFSKEAPWWDPAGSDRSGASNIQNLKFEPQSAREASPRICLGVCF